jgi:hypothetical protein
MHAHTRSLTWRGQTFRFQQLGTGKVRDRAEWAVSRRGEFIGTMACSPEVPTKEFDVRGLRWLTGLLGAPTKARQH